MQMFFVLHNVVSYIVFVSLVWEPTHALKWLSAVQIINVNSVPADLASLLLAALSAPNLQSRSPRDVLLPISSVIL